MFENKRLTALIARSGVGPSNDQWCLTTGGKGAPCSEAISFAIECNDCSNLYGPFKRCSLRESWHATRNAGACLKWGSSAGSKVTEGDIIYGPYDCPNTVSDCRQKLPVVTSLTSIFST